MKILSWFSIAIRHPIIANLLGFLGTILFIAFIVGAIGYLTSSFYLPLRLYFTGNKSIDIIQSVNESLTVTTAGPISSCEFTGRLTSIKYALDCSEYKDVHAGDSVNVFVSTKLRKGVYLKSNNPSLLYILFNFETYGFLFIFYFLFVFGYILYELQNAFKKLSIQIRSEITDEINKSSKPVNVPIAYGKSYTTLLTGVAFSYLFFFLLLKGAYATENGNPIVAGITVASGLSLVLFTPIIFFKIKSLLKKIKRKQIAYLLQFSSFCLGLYTTIMLFSFISTADFTKREDVTKILRDFVKFLLP